MNAEREVVIRQAIELIDTTAPDVLARYLAGTEIHRYLRDDPAALREALARHLGTDSTFGAWKASQQILQAAEGTDFIVTLHNGSGYKELVIRASAAESAMEYARLVCEHQPEDYAGFYPIGTRKA